MKQPIQPLALDEHGVLRFKGNALVRYILDNGGIDMNDLAVIDFPQEDQEQFAQLIGYSLCGFGELSYVSDETYYAAEKMFEAKTMIEAPSQDGPKPDARRVFWKIDEVWEHKGWLLPQVGEENEQE